MISEVDAKRAHFCAEFSRMVDALELSDLEVSKIFEISRPTVGRWKRGEAAPHWIGQPLILQALEKRMEEVGRNA